jgi:hypothetical protein
MKTTLLLLVGFALLATTAHAQDDAKLRNDPTYSTQNYKHANKAAKARQWEEGRGVTVQAPATTGNQVGCNYKQQRLNQPATGGVSVEHTPNERLANRNYKQQQPLQTSSDADVARKNRKAKEGSVTGE